MSTEKLGAYHALDCETGARVEVLLTPEEAYDWDIGTVRVYEGREMQRVPVYVQPGFTVGAVARNLKVVSWSEVGLPGATAYMDPYTGQVSTEYNPRGVALYDSERDLAATARLTGGKVVHAKLLGEKDDARPEPKPERTLPARFTGRQRT